MVRASKNQDVYELAAVKVLQNNTSIRKASKIFDLYYMTLYRYIKKKKNNECPTIGYIKSRLIFMQEAEDKLASYLLKCSDIYFELLPMEVRKLTNTL